MKKKLVVAFGLFIVCACSYAEELITVHADTEAMQRLSEQRDIMQNLLSDVDKRYGETAAVLKKLQSQIEQKRKILESIRQDIDRYKTDVDKLRNELVEQVRVAYAFGQKNKIKLLLNQQDPTVSSRIMIYFNYFNKERLKKLLDLESAVHHLDDLDNQREAETAVLEQDLERIKSQQMALYDAKKQRSDLLERMDRDFSSTDQQLSQLQESEDSLRLLMSSLYGVEKGESSNESQANKLLTDKHAEIENRINFSNLKGNLPWPVTGQLAHKFGSARTEVTWDGVLIDANEGMDVKAVSRGKVIFAEWLRGYGLMMILDHGRGYSTLYAFNQSLYRKAGDSVEAGEVIASVGQSGGRSKAGLYFGIRNKGVPIDPLEWCRR
jgi:septal ring factor EnvC (AmiA/AmiB activator)